MGDNGKSRRGRKIIILSRDAAFARGALEGGSDASRCCLRVTSPYEAAAELIEDAPAALIVDLRCLTPGDLPLIEMARRGDVEVLAVGAIPLGVATSDLSGVRLAVLGHLDVLLDCPESQPLAGAPATVVPRAASADAADLPTMSRWVAKTPIDRVETPRTKTPVAVQDPQDDRAIETPRTDPIPSPGDSPDELLTREELTALLEDD